MNQDALDEYGLAIPDDLSSNPLGDKELSPTRHAPDDPSPSRTPTRNRTPDKEPSPSRTPRRNQTPDKELTPHETSSEDSDQGTDSKK